MSELLETVGKSTAPAIIELFEIDCTNIPGMSEYHFYFTPMVNTENAVNGGVVFNGNTYLPFPIAISGLTFNAEGAPARPQLTISNVNKLLGSLSFTFQDVIGAKVIYTKTFEIYLNSPTPTSAPPLKFTIAKKVSHNMTAIAFELRSPLDREQAFLPKRQMLKRDFPGLGINKVMR
jgi:lambda family phage minor tail protein L